MSITEFFDAIRAGDSAKVRALLDADPEIVSAKDAAGVSACVLLCRLWGLALPRFSGGQA